MAEFSRSWATIEGRLTEWHSPTMIYADFDLQSRMIESRTEPKIDFL